VPLAAVGPVLEPVQAEQILLTGQADVVLLGRELLRDANFALRAADALHHEDAALIPMAYHLAHR